MEGSRRGVGCGKRDERWISELWWDSGRSQCWHSTEQEGPRLKDTRTNNQLQILFNHNLSSPNYPKKLHKEHHYHLVLVPVLCACTHMCSACLLKRDSLADWLFTCSQLIIIVVRYFGCILQIQQSVFLPPASNHTLHLYWVEDLFLCLAPSAWLIATLGSTQAKKT